MESEMFLCGGLDHPNQVELPRENGQSKNGLDSLQSQQINLSAKRSFDSLTQPYYSWRVQLGRAG
jgi:hypothetical protein